MLCSVPLKVPTNSLLASCLGNICKLGPQKITWVTSAAGTVVICKDIDLLLLLLLLKQLKMPLDYDVSLLHVTLRDGSV